MQLTCPLCSKVQQGDPYFQKKTGEIYHHCKECDLIFLDPRFHLGSYEEHQRYLTHENDVQDAGYQDYLKPIVETVLEHQTPKDLGLDYGCGPSSVASYLLHAQNFNIVGYDPYFFPRQELLQKKYDYIVATEVVEHFYQPHQDFELLRNLLNSQGRLYIRTALTDFVKDFERWHYHRDPTHVVFYSKESFKWIARKWGWQILELEKEKVVLQALA